MKLVILGAGGMGVISLSKIIAQMCIEKEISVHSSEIHGMAKKGGLVEIQMRIGDGKSGVVLQKTADYSIVLDKAYLEYGLCYLKDRGRGLIVLEDNDKEGVVRNLGDVRFTNALILGRFLRSQTLFDKNDALAVLKRFKLFEKNKLSFERGLL